MAIWSQSHFLQSLGWATLNSFWQMALLWCICIAAFQVFKFSSGARYWSSVIALITGFMWFIFTFIYFFKSSLLSSVFILNQNINESNSLLHVFLFSASVAYLGLLIFPSYHLFKNWLFVQRIKKNGLQKAGLNYRLFVQKISSQLCIKQKVVVFVSELVSSPLTVGFLKPVILLPVAALNNLTSQQVEAILLHELSHIRRYDYLVNFLISIINAILYFNPFVKQFMRLIEEERENCSDQLVLQFGYDRVSYASALLSLEKFSAQQEILVLGAAGKKYLLNRIEKIIGVEKKKGLKRNQFAAILSALFCVILFNSILIIKEKKENSSFAYTSIANPFDFSDEHTALPDKTSKPRPVKPIWVFTPEKTNAASIGSTNLQNQHIENLFQPASGDAFINASANETDDMLSKEQKDKVRATVNATKKIVGDLQWKEVDNIIADAMTGKEKAKAKQEYFDELDKTVNWNHIEENMKANYEHIDWPKINNNVANALVEIKLDSLQKSYSIMLSQLERSRTEIYNRAKIAVSPMPDQSLQEIGISADELRKKVEAIKAIRSPKKIVHL